MLCLSMRVFTKGGIRSSYSIHSSDCYNGSSLHLAHSLKRSGLLNQCIDLMYSLSILIHQHPLLPYRASTPPKNPFHAYRAPSSVSQLNVNVVLGRGGSNVSKTRGPKRIRTALPRSAYELRKPTYDEERYQTTYRADGSAQLHPCRSHSDSCSAPPSTRRPLSCPSLNQLFTCEEPPHSLARHQSQPGH